MSTGLADNVIEHIRLDNQGGWQTATNELGYYTVKPMMKSVLCVTSYAVES